YTRGSERGVFKTTDGGKTWKKTLFVDEDTGFCDLAIDPQNPDVLFAAGYECRRRAWHFYAGGDGGGIWRSQDGGETWTKLRGGLPAGTLGRIGLAVFPADPRIVYAFIENRNPPKEAEAPERTARTEPAAMEEAREASATREGDAREAAPPRATGVNETREAEPRRQPGRRARGARAGNAARATGGGGGGGEVAADGELIASGDPAWERAAWRAELAPEEIEPANARIRGGEVWRSDDGGDTWKCVKERLISD